MVTTLDDKKRLAIARELAGMKVFQNLLISNEQKLISVICDQDVGDRLRKMLADDQQNIGILDDMLFEHGQYEAKTG